MQEEDADRTVVPLQLLREQLLGDEAQLEILAREDVDGVDDLRQRREELPFVDGFPECLRAWPPGNGRFGREAPRLVGFSFGGPFGPHTRVPVIAVIIRLTTLGEDTGVS